MEFFGLTDCFLRDFLLWFGAMCVVVATAALGQCMRFSMFFFLFILADSRIQMWWTNRTEKIEYLLKIKMLFFSSQIYPKCCHLLFLISDSTTVAALLPNWQNIAFEVNSMKDNRDAKTEVPFGNPSETIETQSMMAINKFQQHRLSIRMIGLTLASHRRPSEFAS